jgi:HD-GYP domain-containing protein (c-di-GMP phosphodiesterase class II)
VILGLVILFGIVSLIVYIIMKQVNEKVQSVSSNFVKVSIELLNDTVSEVSYNFERKIDETIFNIKNNPENFELYLTYLLARAPYYFKDISLKELSINDITGFLRAKLNEDNITYYSVKDINDGYFENRLYIRIEDKVYLIFMKFPTSTLNSFFNNLRNLNANFSIVKLVELYSKDGKALDGKVNDFVKERFQEIIAEEGYKRKIDRKNYEFYYPIILESAHSIFGPMVLKISFDFSVVYRTLYIFILLVVIFVIVAFFVTYRFSAKISKDISGEFDVLINNINKLKSKKELYREIPHEFKIKEIEEIASQYSLMAEELVAYMKELNAMNEELETNYREIERMSNELEHSYIDFSMKLARVAEGYDENTGNHIERVGILAAFIAEKLGLSKKIAYYLRYHAPLHDIGKIFIPREILMKKGNLTKEEWGEMKKHTIYGARLIGDSIQFEVARNVALYHHENYDGTGYPYGLEKSEIPIEAMIVHIVDVYDALRSERPYKKSFTHEEAMKIILEGDGRTQPSHFAPEVLEVFKRYESEIEKLWNVIYLN